MARSMLLPRFLCSLPRGIGCSGTFLESAPVFSAAMKRRPLLTISVCRRSAVGRLASWQVGQKGRPEIEHGDKRRCHSPESETPVEDLAQLRAQRRKRERLHDQLDAGIESTLMHD